MGLGSAIERAWRLLLLGGTLLFFGVQATAASPEKLRVCYEPWDPYVFVGEDGQVRGIAVDLLDAALKELGFAAYYEELPFKRCMLDIRQGKFDIALPISAGRDFLAHSDTVFAYWTLAAIVPDDSTLDSPVALDDLKDRRVLLIDGYGYPGRISSWAEQHSNIVNVTYSADGQGLVPFTMLEYGRADVFIEDNYWSTNLIEKNGLGLRVLAPPLDYEVSVSGFRGDLSELRDKVDAILKKRGQVFRDELFLKYTGFTESYFMPAH